MIYSFFYSIANNPKGNNDTDYWENKIKQRFIFNVYIGNQILKKIGSVFHYSSEQPRSYADDNADQMNELLIRNVFDSPNQEFF